MDARDAQETMSEIGGRGAKRVALLIAILAALLAVVETSGGNAEQDAMKSNIDAANLWAFYQAKTIRQTAVRTAAEMLELELAGWPPERQPTAVNRLQLWRAAADRYETEPSTSEGRKELAARAKAAEAVRDQALAADNMFDASSASLQLAIVLASASVVVGIVWLAWIGAAMGLVGLAFAVLGWVAPTMIFF